MTYAISKTNRLSFVILLNVKYLKIYIHPTSQIKMHHFSISSNFVLSCVRIAVSPQIAPISFGEEPVNAGDLVSVQCVVTKGDSPLEITWTFDGHPIQSYHSDVIVSDTGKRVKQLTIESVAARHAGEYTCVASNAAGSISHSVILDVNGTPFDKSKLAIRTCIFSHLSHPRIILPVL